MNLHSFQRLLQLLRCQNEVWASLKWQAACNSNNILKQHLGSKLTDGYPQITKRQGNIQYIHDGSCKWRGKFGANNTLLSTLAWSSFYWFALSLIEAESKSKRKKITQYTMRESDPTTTFKTIKGVHFPLAVDTTLMWFFFYMKPSPMCTLNTTQCPFLPPQHLWSWQETYSTFLSEVEACSSFNCSCKAFLKEHSLCFCPL